MCCSTGVCGPSIDPNLTRIASAVKALQKNGCDITRYNLASEPEPFAVNETINKLLQEKGPEALPIILVDGEVKKISSYPSNSELANWTGVTEAELCIEKPKANYTTKR